MTTRRVPTCFECNKALQPKYHIGAGYYFTEVNYHGSTVRMHKACAKQFNEQNPHNPIRLQEEVQEDLEG